MGMFIEFHTVFSSEPAGIRWGLIGTPDFQAAFQSGWAAPDEVLRYAGDPGPGLEASQTPLTFIWGQLWRLK